MEMEKTYNHKNTEESVYKMWEEGKYFTPKINKSKKPFTILLPLPNASDPMHMGNMLFTIQDILIRWHRMKGDPTLWLPGGDHAGMETQYVYEKHLVKQGKSRLNYDRNTLYKMISDFVEKNKDVNKNQMRRMGFSLDWTRYKYSL
ncbi:MAG: class I tRNA ligase family protein, partial [bacterium]